MKILYGFKYCAVDGRICGRGCKGSEKCPAVYYPEKEKDKK